MEIPPPLALAMIVCDAIHREPTTGKMFILGTIGSLRGSKFPLDALPIVVYASLTDSRGKVPIRIEVVDAEDEQPPIFVYDSELDFPDPIAVLEHAAVLDGVSFPQAGEYRFQMYCGNYLVMERRILVSSS